MTSSPLVLETNVHEILLMYLTVFLHLLIENIPKEGRKQLSMWDESLGPFCC